MTDNLFNDLTTLTTIPHSSFDKLAEKSQFAICHAVEEAIACGETEIEVNIGIGTIFIKICVDSIKYRFNPTLSLNNNIKKTVITRESPLVNQAETLLKDRICNAYKDLI